jgi:hypothetical protein
VGRTPSLERGSRAERNPMFVFVFVRGLFKFELNTPAFDVLFQLPPRFGKRFDLFPIKAGSYFWLLM